MKQLKNLFIFSWLALFPLFASNAYAVSFPKQTNTYVNDFSNTLSSSEISQLRTDVKAMCDYYSTQIVVCMVSTFGEYDIEEYAAKIGERWGVLKEDGMLILVKPKSDNERGEAMIVTSPDLKDVFSSSMCQEIVSDNMIPHFKNNDYYAGIEAALEYMNNMSDEDSDDDSYASASNVDNNNNDEQSEEKSDGFMKSRCGWWCCCCRQSD